jgi:phosphodiesterase/alkaline phosphatase D-like protein
MTDQTIPQAVPPIDPANQLLGPVNAELTVGVANTTEGQRLILTIRTPSTTNTVFLTRDDAVNWAQVIQSNAAGMSGLVVVGAGGMNGLPKQP